LKCVLILFELRQIQVHDFNECLLQHYINPGTPNIIILILIADTPKDLCVENFIREINLIKEYVWRNRLEKQI
jgi:hypothetical protein